jgi:arsenite methyltransferase
MAEAYRVLRPGGRLAMVDLLLEGSLPPEIQTHPAAWAGCLSGALSERAMYMAMRRARFRAVSIEPIEPFGIEECALYPLFTPQLLDLLRHLVPEDRIDRIATSALIRARKPAPGEDLPGRAQHAPASVGTDRRS